MDDTELLKTLEGNFELAQTLVNHPDDTIEPPTRASTGGRHALEALRRAAASTEGRITKVRTLGEGGMGIVHLATQATLGRHVAVKTLREQVDDLDATVRILREAWVTGALEHPNIVPIYDVGVDATGVPFIIMKRVEGKAWSDAMRDPAELERLLGLSDPLEANLRVFLAVCNAVHFAHARGILHRDIKPENVMIGEFGEVYLLDWGIAVSLREDPSGRLPPLAQAQGIAGTLHYMAPEMLLGDPAGLSELTDVYLLGASLYEIFAGAPPHTGDTTQAIASSILLSTPRFAPGFPQEAQQLCERALSREPAARFESAEAIRKAVEEYLSHRGSRKLAREAKLSFDALLEAIAEPPTEERTLAIFNLLGECRFGYRAALSAWSGNVGARRGLDRALLAVVEHEIAEGDPAGASALLREVSEVPEGVSARVAEALRAEAHEDERLKKLGQDFDPAVGTRTRTMIGSIFGVLWTAAPLAGWWLEYRGERPTHIAIGASSAVSLALGFALFAWARETLRKTLLNRRLARTLGLHLALQMVLSLGAYLLGLTVHQSATLHVLAWAFVQTALAVWVQRWFGVAAAVCAASFLVICVLPAWLYPLMSLCNATFMIILVRVWFPRQDVALFAERRDRIRTRARRILRGVRGREEGDDAA